MIINKTRGSILSEGERVCHSFFSQSLGLMFRRRQNLIMVFPNERKVNLHMFFVFYPLTVLVVDKKGKAVEIKENFRPFTFWSSKEKGKYVVELGIKLGGKDSGEKGQQNVVEMGDRIKFNYSEFPNS